MPTTIKADSAPDNLFTVALVLTVLTSSSLALAQLGSFQYMQMLTGLGLILLILFAFLCWFIFHSKYVIRVDSHTVFLQEDRFGKESIILDTGAHPRYCFSQLLAGKQVRKERYHRLDPGTENPQYYLPVPETGKKVGYRITWDGNAQDLFAMQDLAMREPGTMFERKISFFFDSPQAWFRPWLQQKRDLVATEIKQESRFSEPLNRNEVCKKLRNSLCLYEQHGLDVEVLC